MSSELEAMSSELEAMSSELEAMSSELEAMSSELEAMSQRGLLNLFYADESGVWSEPCLPYGWQWNDEKVFMPSEKGARLTRRALV